MGVTRIDGVEGNPLLKFKGNAVYYGDLDGSGEGGIMGAVFRQIDATVNAGGMIRFNIDGFDDKAALDPSNPLYNRDTSKEFRYIMNHPDPRYRASVRFYENGRNVSIDGCGCEP